MMDDHPGVSQSSISDAEERKVYEDLEKTIDNLPDLLKEQFAGVKRFLRALALDDKEELEAYKKQHELSSKYLEVSTARNRLKMVRAHAEIERIQKEHERMRKEHEELLESLKLQSYVPIRRPKTSEPFRSDFRENFKTISLLGRGGYGFVFESESKLIKRRYAIKRIALQECEIDDALKEILALDEFEHPGIVRYNHSWIEKPPLGWQREADEELFWKIESLEFLDRTDHSAFLYIQMELCKSTLSSWLSDPANNNRDLIRMLPWFKQLVSAVEYIHSKGKFHRDLKPSNVLFSSENRLKICDLGIITDRIIENSQEFFPAVYSAKVDIFALGLILTELCVAMTDDVAVEVFDDYRKGIANTVLSHLPEIEQLVGRLTSQDPDARPECDDILAHVAGISEALRTAFLQPTIAPVMPDSQSPAPAPVKMTPERRRNSLP